MDRRCRAGGATAALAGRQLGEEVGDVGRPRLQRVTIMGAEVLAVLEKISAIRVQGVAREPPLQLQVGEEVEDETLEASASARGGWGPRLKGLDGDSHGGVFPPPPLNPCRARRHP